MQDVVLDTCCLINLYAADHVLEPKIEGKASKRSKRQLDLKLHVPKKVQEEAKYIRKPDPNDSTQLIKTAIDLAPLLAAGALHPCDLANDSENELFVEMAVTLDDGEAACFAIAKNRSWLLATDERPTERLAQKHGLAIITTPEIIKRWADQTKATKARVAQVLRNIQTFANYLPRKTLPLHEWWTSSVKATK